MMLKICQINIFAFLYLVLTFSNLQAQISPGVDFDLQGFIDAEITAGKTTITIPEGRYRVSPKGNDSYILLLSDLNDITIIADHVEMICTETVQGLRIQNCNNLKIRGLNIDYDPLPFTQGEITAISSDKTQITIDVIDGYSTTAEGDKVEIFDAASGELAMATYYGATLQADVPNRKVVITKPNRSFDNLLKLGDIVVLDSRGTRKIPHSIVPSYCTNLTLENVTVYASTSFSFFENYCNGSKYINCSVERRPLETEIKVRGLKRMRSGNADAFHSKRAELGPSYVGCIARYNGDDSYAINGDFHFISETNGNVLTVIAKGGGDNSTDFSIGDIVELVSYTGSRIPNATITQIADGRALNQTEINFLTSRTSFRGAAANTKTANKVYYITIDRPVNLPMGSLINSASRVGNGFEVRNCIAGPNRSRGILVKASNGIITGNTCVGNWGSAIRCSPEYNWLEAGSGNNIEISNNIIQDCYSNFALAVDADAGSGGAAPVGAHDDIRIFNNQIINPLGTTSILVTSTSNLCFYGNTYDIGDPEVYTENITNSSNCVSLSMTQIDKNIFSVYPNPVYNVININALNMSVSNVQFKLYDMLGKLVLEKHVESIKGKWELGTSGLAKGLHVLEIKANSQVMYYKILKN